MADGATLLERLRAMPFRVPYSSSDAVDREVVSDVFVPGSGDVEGVVTGVHYASIITSKVEMRVGVVDGSSLSMRIRVIGGVRCVGKRGTRTESAGRMVWGLTRTRGI